MKGERVGSVTCATEQPRRTVNVGMNDQELDDRNTTVPEAQTHAGCGGGGDGGGCDGGR